MDIGFAFPLNQLHWWIGCAAAIMAVLVLLLLSFEKQRRVRLLLFAEAHLSPRLLSGFDEKIRRPLFWFTLLGFLFLILTFAQPHWGQAWHKIERQSHDVVVCLDTSESMNAMNPLPSRIERAKQKIVSILQRTAGDRFGLVAFSGDAVSVCPLTVDHGYFKAVLNAIDTDTLSTEGTDIAAALREAVKTFQEEDKRSGDFSRDSRAILLISDGEQVSGDAVKEAENAAKYANVYVIGVGDPNGAEVRYPAWMARSDADAASRKPHISRLDEETLTKIGVVGKGGYIRSTPDNADVDKIYGRIQELAARSVSGDLRMRLVNRYQWPLAFAFLFFLAEGIWLAAVPWIRVLSARREAKGTGNA